MHLVSTEIEKYIDQHCSDESDALQQLNRKTQTDVLMPQMLSGKVQGQFLQLFSHAVQPNRVLEIGTYTGYSAICLAEGLAKNGQLISIDINEELSELASEFIEKAGHQSRIRLLHGKAAEIIPSLDMELDLVFIDADKTNYSLYFDLVIDHVKSGGFILADNVLYHGDVLEHETAGRNAKAMHAYNEKILNDSRVECVLLPLRDGVMISRKK